MRIEDVFYLVKSNLKYLLLHVIVISSFSGLNAQPPRLTVQTDGTPGATVSPVNPIPIPAGQSRGIEVTTTPDGYLFAIWTATTNAQVEDVYSEKTTVRITDDATVTANFTEEEGTGDLYP
jgi:hypothetical protein